MYQTAVGWLVNELENHHVFHDIKNTIAYQQAKEMERNQIMIAYEQGDIQLVNSNQYYNETYGKADNSRMGI